MLNTEEDHSCHQLAVPLVFDYASKLTGRISGFKQSLTKHTVFNKWLAYCTEGTFILTTGTYALWRALFRQDLAVHPIHIHNNYVVSSGHLPWLTIFVLCFMLVSLFNAVRKSDLKMAFIPIFALLGVTFMPICISAMLNGEMNAGSGNNDAHSQSMTKILSPMLSVMTYQRAKKDAVPSSIINGEAAALAYHLEAPNKSSLLISDAEVKASNLRTKNDNPVFTNSWFYQMDMAAYGKPVHAQAIQYKQNVEMGSSVFADIEHAELMVLIAELSILVLSFGAIQFRRKNAEMVSSDIFSSLSAPDN
jgi:hypothetical protein